MLNCIKDKIAQILDDIQRRKEEKAARRTIKSFLWTIALAVGLFSVGYLIGANRELIGDLISRD